MMAGGVLALRGWRLTDAGNDVATLDAPDETSVKSAEGPRAEDGGVASACSR